MTRFVKLEKPGEPLFVNPQLVAGVTLQERPNGRPRSLVNVFGREYSVYGTPAEVLDALGIELPGEPVTAAEISSASTAAELDDTL